MNGILDRITMATGGKRRRLKGIRAFDQFGLMDPVPEDIARVNF